MISPLDERYSEQIKELFPIFSEFNLMFFRTQIEIVWLFALEKAGLFRCDSVSKRRLEQLLHAFSQADFIAIKEQEKITRHDVKAVEYFLKNYLMHSNTKLVEWVHFGLTSEDVNNLSYALILSSARKCLLTVLTTLKQKLKTMALAYADQVMLSRTHGQCASPTTFGKEVANFVARLQSAMDLLANTQIFGKINGAVGNFNALVFCFPNVDWLALTKALVEGLGLNYQRYTTQIEPHDWIGIISAHLVHINVILIDLARDFWSYNALGYLKLRVNEQEVGSSTMPHKVNPIDLENGEGNLGIANALLQHFSLKLPISRWQRDLSDSTVLRNLGVAMGHSLLAYRSLTRGLDKITVNPLAIQQDLDQHWEILAEPIQMVLRQYGVQQGYELLKQLTRGKQVDKQTIEQLIKQLPLPLTVREQLLNLTPNRYVGLAIELAKTV